MKLLIRLFLLGIVTTLLGGMYVVGQEENPIPLPGDRTYPLETNLYTDQIYRYSLNYPEDWSFTVDIENPVEEPDRVILRGVTFVHPSGEAIYVDVWENTKDKDLFTLYKKYHKKLLSSAAPEIEAANGTIAGVPAILVTDPSTKKERKVGSIFPSQAVIFLDGDYVYRIEYQKTLNGEAESGMNMILQSFTLPDGTRSTSDLTQLTSLPVTKAVSPRVARCGPLYDPTNPYPCCVNRDGTGGNCTWYARYRRPDFGSRGFGHAKTWLIRAKQAGFPTGKTPEVGAIAVWTGGTHGHVAYVEEVLNSTYIRISQMNCKTPPAYTPSKKVARSGIAGYIYKKTSVKPPTPTPSPSPTAIPTATPTSTPEYTVSYNRQAAYNWLSANYNSLTYTPNAVGGAFVAGGLAEATSGWTSNKQVIGWLNAHPTWWQRVCPDMSISSTCDVQGDVSILKVGDLILYSYHAEALTSPFEITQWNSSWFDASAILVQPGSMTDPGIAKIGSNKRWMQNFNVYDAEICCDPLRNMDKRIYVRIMAP